MAPDIQASTEAPIPPLSGPRTGSRLAWAAAILLAAVPPLILVSRLLQFGYRFPYWDEWHLAPLLERVQQGQLGFIEVWVQHNEHRPLVPRLLMLSLARLSGWNVGWELAVSVAVAAGTFALLLHQGLRASPPRRPFWLAPVFSLLVFSWSQMENWVWGWQLQVFLSTLAVVAGVMLLAGAAPSGYRFAGALAMGVVASYSFANGLLYWFAALPVVLATPKLSRDTRIVRAALWAVVGFLTLQSYLVEYEKPGVSPEWASSPLEYLGYVILYLGSPVSALFARPPWHGPPPPAPAVWHFVPGILGCMAFAVLLAQLSRCWRASWPVRAPWLSLAAYALGSALVTGAGRAGFGIAQALSSRYITIASLFWCALFALLALYLDTRPRLRLSRGLAASGAALLAVTFLGLNVWSVRVNRYWEDVATWKRLGWQAILAGYEAPLYLQDLCWDPAELENTYLPIVKRYGLCGFDQPRVRDPRQAAVYVSQARRFIERRQRGPARTYLDTALFFDPAHVEAAALRSELCAHGPPQDPS